MKNILRMSNWHYLFFTSQDSYNEQICKIYKFLCEQKTTIYYKHKESYQVNSLISLI